MKSLNVERQERLQNVTKKLVIFTFVIVSFIAIMLYNPFGIVTTIGSWFGAKTTPDETKHSFLVLLVFIAGLLGGFVSIQQRLPNIELEELKVLSNSWFSIALIPINGGIFALALMLMFIGNIIDGSLFPQYAQKEIGGTEDFLKWLTEGYPKTNVDIAKLLVWSFVAGFSERFVPQIIRTTTNQVTPDTKEESIKTSEDQPKNKLTQRLSNRKKA